jgi:hypothetical protein
MSPKAHDVNLEIVNWPVAIGGCILCYLVSALTLIRSAASAGVAHRVITALPWITRGAMQESKLQKVRVAGVAFVAFLMGSYLLYLIITLR